MRTRETLLKGNTGGVGTFAMRFVRTTGLSRAAILTEDQGGLKISGGGLGPLGDRHS